MSLYDLFGFTQEERSQVRKRKTRRKKEDSGQLSLFDMPPLEQHSAMQTTPAEPTPQEKERQEQERLKQERLRQEEKAARQERMKPRPYPAGLLEHHRNGCLLYTSFISPLSFAFCMTVLHNSCSLRNISSIFSRAPG